MRERENPTLFVNGARHMALDYGIRPPDCALVIDKSLRPFAQYLSTKERLLRVLSEDSDVLRQNIDRILKRAGWTLLDLAKATEIEYSLIHRFMRPKPTPVRAPQQFLHYRHFIRIARALKVSLDVLADDRL